MSYENAKSVRLTKIEELLTGTILRVSSDTYIRVESVSFTELPETEPQFPITSRYIYLNGPALSLRTYTADHKAEITAYRKTNTPLFVKKKITDYTTLDLFNEIIENYPIVKDTEKFNAQVRQAQNLVTQTVTHLLHGIETVRKPEYVIQRGDNRYYLVDFIFNCAFKWKACMSESLRMTRDEAEKVLVDLKDRYPHIPMEILPYTAESTLSVPQDERKYIIRRGDAYLHDYLWKTNSGFVWKYSKKSALQVSKKKAEELVAVLSANDPAISHFGKEIKPAVYEILFYDD